MNYKKLRIALKANALFSTISGLWIIFQYQQIAERMQISNATILLIIGIILLPFAFFVYKTATAEQISPKKVKFIISQDWLWVVGSVLIIALQAFGINKIGFIIIGVVAIIVADFAFFQQRYLKAKA